MTVSNQIESVDIITLKQAEKELELLDCDPQSIAIMAPKALFHTIRINNVLMQDAIIIKQHMLSLGGEAAISRQAYHLKESSAPMIVMGTHHQISRIIEKLSSQYPRLKQIGKDLEGFLKK